MISFCDKNPYGGGLIMRHYIGTCCGAGPHHVRAIAEALGRTVPSSRYSPDLSQHAMLGKTVLEHNKPDMDKWKDK